MTIVKSLVTAPWYSFGIYALSGNSTISFGGRIINESVCEALGKIREQNPTRQISIVTDYYSFYHAKFTQEQTDERGTRPASPPTVFADVGHIRTALEEPQTRIIPESIIDIILEVS